MTTEDILAMFAMADKDNLYVRIYPPEGGKPLLTNTRCAVTEPVGADPSPFGVITIVPRIAGDYYTNFPVETAKKTDQTLELRGPKGLAIFSVVESKKNA